MMESATALCACGVAFFLRSIRAASQGGIEIGFHPEEALLMAAQTARRGPALREGAHPEAEIDRVTTPRGCTIAGLNEMDTGIQFGADQGHRDFGAEGRRAVSGPW